MALLISIKDNLARKFKDPDVGTAFRQIENWGNAYNPIILGYAMNWADVVNLTASMDPFGYVHLHGQPQYTAGVVADNTLIATLPPKMHPRSTWRFATFSVRAGMFIDINTSGQLLYRTGTDPTPAAANPELDFTFDPRQ